MSVEPLLSVAIVGAPVGKGRPRVTRQGRAYTPEKTRTWEAAASAEIARTWGGRPAWLGPVRVEVDAVGARPQRLLGKKNHDGRLWRLAKPDADNVAKIAMDALVMARVLGDDIQVVEITRARSLYTARNEGPRVEIRMFAVTGQP